MANNGVELLLLVVQVIVVCFIDYSFTQVPICGKERFSDAICSPNYYLTGASNLLSRQTSSKIKCFAICLRLNGCKSVNFNIGTHECLFLGSTQNELPVENFMQSEDSYYCEIAAMVRTNRLFTILFHPLVATKVTKISQIHSKFPVQVYFTL